MMGLKLNHARKTIMIFAFIDETLPLQLATGANLP